MHPFAQVAILHTFASSCSWYDALKIFATRRDTQTDESIEAFPLISGLGLLRSRMSNWVWFKQEMGGSLEVQMDQYIIDDLLYLTVTRNKILTALN